MTNTTHRDIAVITAELNKATIDRKNWINVQNEGAGGYVDDSKVEALCDELYKAEAAIRKANSPLIKNLAAERAWFNAQGYTQADMQKANKACRARGYSVSELMSAAKVAK